MEVEVEVWICALISEVDGAVRWCLSFRFTDKIDKIWSCDIFFLTEWFQAYEK